DDHRNTQGGSAEKYAGHAGNVQSAYLCEHVYDIVFLGTIQGDCLFDSGNFTVQPFAGKACPSSGYLLWRGIQQYGCDGAAGGSISDSHLAGGDNLIPFFL